jgi:hypothetical protein
MGKGEKEKKKTIIEKAHFALNVSMLRSKGDWVWRQQGRVTGLAGEYGGRG